MYNVELVMYGRDDTTRPRWFSFIPSRLQSTHKSRRKAEDRFDQMVAEYGCKFKPSYTYGVFLRIICKGRTLRIMQVN